MKNFSSFCFFLILLLFFSSCSGGENPQTLPHNNVITQGDSYKSISVDGLDRGFLIHVPHNYSLDVYHPVIFALHGGGGSPENMVKLTRGGFNTISEENGVLIVYPEAVEKHWNDGRGLDIYYSQRENIDDVKFLSHLINYCIEHYKVDPDRVYFTGMSNGALMCFRLIDEISAKIAAVAPVCGSISETIFPYYAIESPLSILIINGTEDPIIPWDGGNIVYGDLELGKVLAIEYVFNFLGNFFSCKGSDERSYLPDKDTEDGTRVWIEGLTLCNGNVVVKLCGVEGGGHTWPSGFSYLPESIIGKTCYDIDGCRFIWSFFKDKQKFH